ncbi:MAG: hypothetical protein LBK74_08295, partial [Treponema sp.]|nr:hypothetical protein [Treponema sp.]
MKRTVVQVLAVIALVIAAGCSNPSGGGGNEGPEGPPPVSQTITIPGYNSGNPVFSGTLTDGESASAVITITAENKTGITGWGPVSVSIPGNFTAANMPTFTITVTGGGGTLDITAAQKTRLDTLLNDIMTALAAGNVNVPTPSYSNITVDGQEPGPVSQTLTITIPGYNSGSPIFNEALADGDSKSAAVTITDLNKGGIESWGTPSVAGLDTAYTAINKPAFTITVAG